MRVGCFWWSRGEKGWKEGGGGGGTTHGWLEGRAELELVEADEAAVGVHDAVVVVHG